MQRVWQESAMVSSLVSKRHCRGRSSATGPGGTTERHQQKIRQTLKIYENMTEHHLNYNLRHAAFEIFWIATSYPAIWCSRNQALRNFKIRREKLQGCVCGCARVCPINKLRCLRCITECYGCANFAREFQCTGFAKLLDKSSQAAFAVWACHCWCNSCETNCGAASCAERFFNLLHISSLHSTGCTTHHFSIISWYQSNLSNSNGPSRRHVG